VRRIALPLFAAAVALALLAEPAGAVKANSEAKRAPAVVVADAIVALARSHSVKLTGSLDGAAGRLGIDIVMSNGHGGGGRLTQRGTLDFVVAPPELFLRADAAYWMASGADQATAANLAGKWLKTSTTNQRFTNLVQLADVVYWAKQIDLQSAPITKQRTTRYHGKKVVPIHDPTPGSETTLYVAATGTPYPVAVVVDSDTAHGLEFARFGTAKRPAPPKGAVALPSQ